MPSNIIKSFASKSGKSEDEVEKLWNKAKSIANDDGRDENDDDFYPYVTGILKNMLGIEEDVQAVSTTTSTGANSGAPSSGSGMAATHTKIGDKPFKRKNKDRIIFKEYLERHNII